MDEASRKARIFEILDEMKRKHFTPEIRNRLRREKLLKDVDVDQQELEETRDWIGLHGRERDRQGHLEQRLFHLTRVMPDGSVEDYWRQIPSTVPVESGQILAVEAKRCRRQDAKFHRIYRLCCRTHGKRVIDQTCDFRFPEDPGEEPDDGNEDDGDA